MTSEIITPNRQLWSLAEATWPLVRNTRRPMYLKLVAPEVEQTLRLELQDETIGAGRCSRLELKKALFLIEDEDGSESSLLLTESSANSRALARDPYVAYYAELFKKVSIERSIA